MGGGEDDDLEVLTQFLEALSSPGSNVDSSLFHGSRKGKRKGNEDAKKGRRVLQ